jgi:hypothetical protein
MPPRPSITSMISWVCPVFVLRRAHVERRAGDAAPLLVAVADDEVVLRIAHRRGAVAATAGLVEQHRPVPFAQPLDQRLGGGRGEHLGDFGGVVGHAALPGDARQNVSRAPNMTLRSGPGSK